MHRNVILGLFAPIVFALILSQGDAAGPPYLSSVSPAPASSIHFKRVQLDDKFRSEGCCVGDFNHDGKLDIAAGSVYFTTPIGKCTSFARRPMSLIRCITASRSSTYSADLNGDGWTDFIVVGFPGKDTSWFENPRRKRRAVETAFDYSREQ